MQPDTEPGFDAMTSFVPVERKERVLSAEEVRGFMKIKPWRVAFDIAMFWGMVLGTFAIAFAFPHWWVWALCFVAMGCLQNAIITWTHEASHSNLNRNKKLNDRVADFLLAGPAGISAAWTGKSSACACARISGRAGRSICFSIRGSDSAGSSRSMATGASWIG